MSKYKVIFYWADGTFDEDDNYGKYYDSYEEADSAGQYGLECVAVGAEILNLSNPGDYPYDESEFEDHSYEVEEVSD